MITTELILEFDFQDETKVKTMEYELKKLGPLNCALNQFVNLTSNYKQPIVRAPTFHIPKDIRALYRLSTPLLDVCPHFFTDDSHIEPIWSQPLRYLKVLQKYGWTIAPDFSLYMDMFSEQKHWNAFRSKFLAAFWQYFGVEVIPAPSWGDIKEIELYLDGWPTESIIALNSTGIGNDKRGRKQFMDGYQAVLDILKPTHILRYGTIFVGENKDISTYNNNNNNNRKEIQYGCK